MTAWWQTLTALEHVLLYIAIPATLILLIQTVLLFVGGSLDDGGADTDTDTDVDTDVDLDADLEIDLDADLDADLDGAQQSAHQGAGVSGLHIFTVRGVVAFLTLFGWGGLALLQTGLSSLLAIFLALAIGVAGMVGIAFVVREAVKLQYDGTLDPRNALGLPGEVYLTVPPGRVAPGKVSVLVQDQLREFDAVTDSPDPIPTGTSITVAGLLAGGALLLVTPAPHQPSES